MHPEATYLKNTYYDTIQDKDIFLYSAAKKDADTFINTGRQTPVLTTAELEQYHHYRRDDRIPFSNDMPMDQGTKSKINHIISRTYIDTVNFQIFSKRPFLITDNLTQRLMNTNLNADCQFLMLPFPCSMFVYTDPVMIEAMYESAGSANKNQIAAPVTVYLTQYKAQSGHDMIRIDAYHPDKTSLSLYVEDEITVMPDITISEYLAKERPHLAGKKAQSEGFHFDEQQDAILPEDSMPFMKTVLNTILYLASNDPDIREQVSQRQQITHEAQGKKNPTKRDKALERARQYSSLPYTIVGLNTKPLTDQRPDTGTGRKLTVRFIVKGHWKSQPYGQNRAKRYPRWIEPYYKGPEMAEAANRPYIVR